MKDPEVSLVLPVYNETARLVSGFFEIISYLQTVKNFTWEIIMVDDGSNIPASEVIDHSYLKKTVTRLAKRQQFIGIRLPVNHGKGYAIGKGVIRARGKIIVFADIDGSVGVSHIHKVVAKLQNHDIAIASRRIEGSVIAVHQSLFRELGGRVYTFLSRTLFSLPIHDVTCGFKAFRAPLARTLFAELTTSRWAFDTEILARAQAHRYSMVEVPVVWENKVGSQVKLKDTVGSFLDVLGIFWKLKIRERLERKGGEMSGFTSLQRSKKVTPKRCDLCGSESFKFLFDHHHGWKVQQCRVCLLTQVVPRPDTKDIAKLYHADEDHFSPYIEQEVVHRAYFQTKLKQVKELLDSRKNITLLDIGCLTGVLLNEAVSTGMKAEGLDISKDAVAYCRSRGLIAHQGTIADFSKKNKRKKYDVITAFEIIEHEYSPYTMVRSIYELLLPGGVILMSTPNHGSWWRVVMGKYWPGYTHPEHLYFFDPTSLKNIVKQAGFRDIIVVSGDSRPFPLWFLFSRGADYFPLLAPVLKFISILMKPTGLKNPLNPWDDLLVIGRK
jgi:dolichyl-phosphate beta-glucosyltransferase